MQAHRDTGTEHVAYHSIACDQDDLIGSRGRLPFCVVLALTDGILSFPWKFNRPTTITTTAKNQHCAYNERNFSVFHWHWQLPFVAESVGGTILTDVDITNGN